jgi:hypothetical protein
VSGRRDQPLGLGARLTLAALVASVGLGVLALAFRDNLYRELIEPAIPFQVADPPGAPDWQDASAWAARPQDGGATRPDAPPGEVDVFYVHPTTDYGGRAEVWNADPRDHAGADRLTRVVLPNHAAPFAAAGPLWIPQYRQATLFAMIASREDTRDALSLAYGDVAAAFEAFLAARPASAPFILAGTGQGGLHVTRLLQEELAGQAAARGLVAAYILDQPVPQDLFAPGGPLAAFGLCVQPRQTGCVVTYATVDNDDRRGAQMLRERGLFWQAGAGYGRIGERQIACVNPLTGGAGAQAPASANPGAVAATGLEPGAEPPTLPGETGAACTGGLLLVDPDRQSALRSSRLDIGARYTTPGWNLFYSALSADARSRASAFGARQTSRPSSP